MLNIVRRCVIELIPIVTEDLGNIPYRLPESAVVWWFAYGSRVYFWVDFYRYLCISEIPSNQLSLRKRADEKSVIVRNGNKKKKSPKNRPKKAGWACLGFKCRVEPLIFLMFSGRSFFWEIWAHFAAKPKRHWRKLDFSGVGRLAFPEKEFWRSQ